MRSLLLTALCILSSTLGVEAGIVWLAKHYDFGLMKEAAGPKEGNVAFVNMGPDEVVVTDAKPSCGCTGVFFPDEPISPGDTAVISFVYNPKGRPGKFDKSIRVYIGENEVHRIGISGNVLGTPESLSLFYPVEAGSLRLSEPSVGGGEMTHGSTHTFFVNVYNQAPDSISPVVECSDPALTVSLSEPRLGPGDIASLSFFFNSRKVAETGDVEIPVTLRSDSESEDTLIIPFRIRVTPDFSRLSTEEVDRGPRCYVAPSTIDLGIVGAARHEFSFLIENQGKSPMRVIRISSPTGQPKIELDKKPDKIKAGKSATVHAGVDLSSVSPGPFRIPIEVSTDDPLHPARKISLVGIIE